MSEGPGSNLSNTLEDVVEISDGLSVDMPYPLLDDNGALDNAYSNFQLKYEGLSIEKMPDETESGGPYSDYMTLEEIYARCNPPTELNQEKMSVLRDVMQRYAENQRDEDTRENKGSSFLEEITRFETMYGHHFLNELHDEEAARYQTMKSIVLMDHEKLDPKVSSALVHLMISMGDPDTAKKPYKDLM